MIFELDVDGALNLTAKAVFRVVFGEDDSGSASLERFHNFLSVVANAGDNAHSGDDDASHFTLPLDFGADRPKRCVRTSWSGLLGRILKQADAQILRFVDQLAVGLDDALGDAKHRSEERRVGKERSCGGATSRCRRTSAG